jgi:Tfp pilus assembly protein PilX
MEQGVMKTSPIRSSPLNVPRSRQRGVILFIALIVMVVMSLAAIALMRSVDTTTAVIGNLAFRQASMLPANYAVEDAAAGLFADASPSNAGRITVTGTDLTQNYCATHPCAAALTRKQVDGAQNTVTYVIERMCTTDAEGKAADRSLCEMMPPKAPPGKTSNDPSAGLDFKLVYYRVTVRVDGPPGTNTVSFAQAMLR